MSDCIGCSVVVVNKAGNHRFTYTGPPPTFKDSFDPRGIATDSQSRILTTDYTHRRVHVLDQDGAFLRYIANCDLDCPWGLCLDSRNNMFIAEWETGKVNKNTISQLNFESVVFCKLHIDMIWYAQTVKIPV